jgi:homogentisate 1,2-dioxygenase
MSELRYLTGFGSHQSEALEGALPVEQNSPRLAPYGLYAEQLNGVPFTVPRVRNRRSWLYRIRPSVSHGEFSLIASGRFSLDYLQAAPTPNLIGWRARALPSGEADFVDSLETVMGAGDPADQRGLAFHTFATKTSMGDRALYNADGDMMILPDTGELHIVTEMGQLRVGAGELAVIPRGVLFHVTPIDGQPARGFVVEIYGRQFELPNRGPIGANGLAAERHFQTPVAHYEDREVDGGYTIVAKMGGALYQASRSHSPFDVVAWHGNCAPYRYDLAMFNAMGTVSFDHPDPSIFTVMSAPLDRPGESLADLVMFPVPRWDVAQHTFRPPFFHRNAATELNFLVGGEPRKDEVFSCGGIFYTPPFAAHGPAVRTVQAQLEMSDDKADAPHLIDGDTIWMQVESALALRVAPWAVATKAGEFREYARTRVAHFDANDRDVLRKKD